MINFYFNSRIFEEIVYYNNKLRSSLSLQLIFERDQVKNCSHAFNFIRAKKKFMEKYISS